MPQDWKDLLKDKFAEELSTIVEETPTAVPTPRFRKQKLLVTIDRRRRAGKQVTLVSGFAGDEEALEELARALKTRLGTGGSVKEGEIVIQGDVRDKLVALLKEMGHEARRGN
jgi:translation initiation factor 1